MIRSDMITDHGLELPDLCDFPGAGDSLYPTGINFDHVANIRKAFDSRKFPAFKTAWSNMTQEISQYANFSPEEKAILASQNKYILKAVRLWFESCDKQVERNDLPITDLYKTLDHDGCVGFKDNKRYIQDINTLLSKEIAELSKVDDHTAAAHAYDRFKMINEKNNPELYRLVREFFNDHQVFQAISKYNRMERNMDLDTIALHVATPTDTHHYMTLRDMETTSQLISLHMDPKYNLMKSILYLNEVDEDTGPFTTIPTSNRWEYDQLERMIACGNSTGNYLDTPTARRVMRYFPKEFRKNVIIGRYILDGTPMSDKLLGLLHPWTSDEADCIVFDPTQTLHRGGLCKTRNRVNLQILMR